MTKLIIDMCELEDKIAKLSTLSTQLGVITEHIDLIDEKKDEAESKKPMRYRHKNIAFGLAYILEDYCEALTNDFNELVEKAPQIRE